MGKQCVILENHSDIALLRGQPAFTVIQGDTVKAKLTRSQRQQAGNRFQQGGFTTTTCAKQTDNFARIDLQRERFQYGLCIVLASEIFNQQCAAH
ncbi:Uncharacterised protein [Vibrio cholerae]|uniref:Uncharacterized protein n=1 Tax=Vibrio cholerae TaxID=666 RepID=A0A655Q9Z1_VIBCL|nr:Uncharacterised protein [Vibrio cholerae]CSA45647.1 Uncharacterised protein [Vibrio cholerae]CSA59485.1 Uncharacterised protein [Vibrio cholerae]CSB60564.1 Uncharacterised protein [Vibrio cholerae]CSB66954.1 Uncharacterised protein [Vibrio cholerae]